MELHSTWQVQRCGTYLEEKYSDAIEMVRAGGEINEKENHSTYSKCIVLLYSELFLPK